MQAAHIVPMAYLHVVKDRPYHLCFTDLALRYPGYKEFYASLSRSGKYVMLRPVLLEGEEVDFAKVVQLAVEMQASELILPFYPGDLHKTLDEAYRALHCVKSDGSYKGKIMAVPQAPTFERWLFAALEMLEWPNVDTIGLSETLVHMFGPYARWLALVRLKYRLDFKEIHLLGCTCIPQEVSVIQELGPVEVRGVDSPLPYMYARQGQNLYQAMLNNIELQSRAAVNFYDSETDGGLLATNLAVWERVCEGELIWEKVTHDLQG